MNNLLLLAFIIESVTMVIMLVVFVFLVRTQLRLRQDYEALNAIVRRNSNDIAGLCSAALSVDTRRAVTDQKINDLLVKISEVEQNEHAAHPYSVDIRKVKSGASVNELMQNSGLSHDEAALLIRLHGAKGKKP